MLGPERDEVAEVVVARRALEVDAAEAAGGEVVAEARQFLDRAAAQLRDHGSIDAHQRALDPQEDLPQVRHQRGEPAARRLDAVRQRPVVRRVDPGRSQHAREPEHRGADRDDPVAGRDALEARPGHDSSSSTASDIVPDREGAWCRPLEARS